MFPGRQRKQRNPAATLLGRDLSPLPQRQQPSIAVRRVPSPPLSWLLQPPHATPAAGGEREFSTGAARDGCQAHEAALWVWMHRLSLCTAHKSSPPLPSQLFKQFKRPLFFRNQFCALSEETVSHVECKKVACANKIILPFPGFLHKHTQKELLCIT